MEAFIKLRRIYTTLFYGLLGLVAILGMTLLNYWTLKLNSSLGKLYTHTSLSYFSLYIFFTIATALVFGANVMLLAYQSRRYGFKNLMPQGSTGIGVLLGIFASSCPVCGSTLLSVIGIFSGLSSLPFQGLEIKAVSLLLIIGSSVYSLYRLNRTLCTDGVCPIKQDDALRPSERILFAPITLAIVIFVFIGWHWYSIDSIHSPAVLQSNYSCSIS